MCRVSSIVNCMYSNCLTLTSNAAKVGKTLSGLAVIGTIAALGYSSLKENHGDYFVDLDSNPNKSRFPETLGGISFPYAVAAFIVTNIGASVLFAKIESCALELIRKQN